MLASMAGIVRRARQFELTVDGIAGVLLIKLVGELDADATGELHRCLERAGGVWQRVVVDLSRVRFMDSAGLDVLLAGRSHLGDRLELIVPRDSAVNRLLDLSGESGSFVIHRTAARAP
jgi:anti-anti-sigma factor